MGVEAMEGKKEAEGITYGGSSSDSREDETLPLEKKGARPLYSILFGLLHIFWLPSSSPAS